MIIGGCFIISPFIIILLSETITALRKYIKCRKTGGDYVYWFDELKSNLVIIAVLIGLALCFSEVFFMR